MSIAMQSEKMETITAALQKVQAVIETAKKNRENYFKSGYADMAAIVEVIRKPFADNGLAFSQTIDFLEDKNAVLVTTLFHPASQQFLRGIFPMLAAKQDAQAWGAAQTYARRYGLAALIGIVVEDEPDLDNEGKEGQPAPRPAAAPTPAPQGRPIPAAAPRPVPAPQQAPVDDNDLCTDPQDKCIRELAAACKANPGEMVKALRLPVNREGTLTKKGASMLIVKLKAMQAAPAAAPSQLSQAHAANAVAPSETEECTPTQAGIILDRCKERGLNWRDKVRELGLVTDPLTQADAVRLINHLVALPLPGGLEARAGMK